MGSEVQGGHEREQPEPQGQDCLPMPLLDFYGDLWSLT